MWKSRLGGGFGICFLLACLAFVLTNVRGSESANPGGTAAGTKDGGAEQSSRKPTDPAEPPSPKIVDNDYIIGPSDVLAINVWGEKELSRNVPVRPDGKISLPLIGEMQVSGLTALKVKSLLAARLKEFLSEPQVNVIVEEMKSRTYIVVGKISKPGSYPLAKPTTVLEAIAIAGGFVEFAKENKLYILRVQEDGSHIRLPFNYKKVVNGRDPEENVDLKNGDTIVVP